MVRRGKEPLSRSSRKRLREADEGAPGSEALPPATDSGTDGVFTADLREEVDDASLGEDGARADANARQASHTEIFRPIDSASAELISSDVFDEAGYLRLNPDVGQAVMIGQFESGYSHYLLHGKAEGRPLPDTPTGGTERHAGVYWRWASERIVRANALFD